MDDDKKNLLKQLPKIDEVLSILGTRDVPFSISKDILKAECRSVVDSHRNRLLTSGGQLKERSLPSPEQVADEVLRRMDSLLRYRLRRVINAGGFLNAVLRHAA